MRYICSIPDTVYQTFKSGWQWVEDQGIATLPKAIKDEWFEFYMQYTESALLKGIRQEFQYFRSFGIDEIVDFVEDIVDANSADWGNAVSTIVASGSDLGERIEDIDDQESYLDVYVKLFQWTLPTDSTLELLAETLEEHLKESEVNPESINYIYVDIREQVIILES